MWKFTAHRTSFFFERPQCLSLKLLTFMHSNDPEFPHETGQDGANGGTIAAFSDGDRYHHRTDLSRSGPADRSVPTPAGGAADRNGISSNDLLPGSNFFTRYPSLFPPTMMAGAPAAR
jgi:hypothetical protein